MLLFLIENVLFFYQCPGFSMVPAVIASDWSINQQWTRRVGKTSRTVGQDQEDRVLQIQYFIKMFPVLLFIRT